jgi:D-amino-acid dehydrogenase
MDVIVIGGGIAGITAAYELRLAGHRVSVIEQHGTVAQQATFGETGVLLPSPLDVWFGPTLNGVTWRTRGPDSGWLVRPGLNFWLRGWLRRLAEQRDPQRFAAQYASLDQLAKLARERLDLLEKSHPLEYERRDGVLYLFRTEREFKRVQLALEVLTRLEIPHRVLDAAECVRLEPSIPSEPLAGGVLLEQARSGNCPQFTKQLKQLIEDDGVDFELGRAVKNWTSTASGITVTLGPRTGQHNDPTRAASLRADALVVAAGSGSFNLLARARLKLPLRLLRVHALTAPIAHLEHAPHIALVDAARRISISRLNNRIRIAGAGVMQARFRMLRPEKAELRHTAVTMLGQAAHDWIPGAARLSAGQDWDGTRLLSPDGLPVVGATSDPRVFISLAHGPGAWALACGSAKVIADAVSKQQSELSPATLAALSAARFAA